jgi:hypothetical protein
MAMDFLSYALGAVILVLVLLRQVRVRPVPRVYQPRLPIVLGVIGLLEMLGYAGNHHVSSTAWGWVIGTLAIGALGLGALRGLTMRVWASNSWVFRQGTALTMGLWLVSLLVHFAGDAGGDHAGAAGLEGASFLLYLGVTLAVQYYVVFRRALPLWQQLGPDAGRPLQFHFSQGPGAFFATFQAGGAPGPAGWNPDPDRTPYDPNVIDAEVVDDGEGDGDEGDTRRGDRGRSDSGRSKSGRGDGGPPELHTPR